MSALCSPAAASRATRDPSLGPGEFEPLLGDGGAPAELLPDLLRHPVRAAHGGQRTGPVQRSFRPPALHAVPAAVGEQRPTQLVDIGRSLQDRNRLRQQLRSPAPGCDTAESHQRPPLHGRCAPHAGLLHLPPPRGQRTVLLAQPVVYEGGGGGPWQNRRIRPADPLQPLTCRPEVVEGDEVVPAAGRASRPRAMCRSAAWYWSWWCERSPVRNFSVSQGSSLCRVTMARTAVETAEAWARGSSTAPFGRIVRRASAIRPCERATTARSARSKAASASEPRWSTRGPRASSQRTVASVCSAAARAFTASGRGVWACRGSGGSRAMSGAPRSATRSAERRCW